jgi:excisionase family DNA binding protein
MSRTAISLEEAASVLDVERRTAYQAIRCGQLPRLKLGRRVIVVSTMVIATAVCRNFGHLSVGSTSLRL